LTGSCSSPDFNHFSICAIRSFVGMGRGTTALAEEAAEDGADELADELAAAMSEAAEAGATVAHGHPQKTPPFSSYDDCTKSHCYAPCPALCHTQARPAAPAVATATAAAAGSETAAKAA
jgi:hypothetical protein